MAGSSKEQSIFIVRYGITQFPLVESVGPFDSPIGKEGIEHAGAIAESIRAETEGNPLIIYASPFQRCAHTAHIIAEASSTNVRIEEGLTEWLIPSLLVEQNGKKTEPKSVTQLHEMYDTIDTSYQFVNPVICDDAAQIPKGAPHFPESEENLLARAALTLNRLLEKNADKSLCIVSHAPTDQALALFLEGADPSESKLGPWPLGGITKFSRTGDLWTMCYYGKTDHMPGEYKPGVKHWSLPCLSNNMNHL